MADYFTASGSPATNAQGASSPVRSEFTAIAAGFAKIAAYTGNADKLVTINPTASGQSARSLRGTANQVTVTADAASYTLSLPQNIHAAASPTFAGLTITGPTVTWSGNPTHSGTHTFSGNVTLSGGAKTASGVTSAATGAATTLFAVNNPGLYLVFADVSSSDAANFTAFAYVLTDTSGTGTRIVSGSNGGLLTLTLSGQSLQGTQSSGGTANINWRYQKLST
jgi:hypothetical protein